METERDERGRIVKTTLTHDEAVERGRLSHSKARLPERDELLAELGLSGKTAETLADQAVAGKAGSVPAIKELMRMAGTGKVGSVSGPVKLQPGQVCPTCGAWEGAMGVIYKLLEVTSNWET